MKGSNFERVSVLAAGAVTLALLALGEGAGAIDDRSALISAVCPIAYKLDESPAARGYRYTFFGNAFFINEHGYLLTAAHVLETFRDGGQPYVVLNRVNSPPRLLAVTVVGTDAPHDVAILRVTPNPFQAGGYRVSALPLESEPAAQGQQVVTLSFLAPKLARGHTFEFPGEDSSVSQVLRYESSQLEPSVAATDLFLFSHEIEKGQSGSPVVAQESGAVVGFVEGRWLRQTLADAAAVDGQKASVPGAAVPIRYAIALLQEKGIVWQDHQARGATTR